MADAEEIFFTTLNKQNQNEEMKIERERERERCDWFLSVWASVVISSPFFFFNEWENAQE